MTLRPEPPYLAAVFTSRRRVGAGATDSAYAEAAARMEELARTIPGYLGIESVHDAEGNGITVSYWADDEAMARWRDHPEHLDAQHRGRSDWYEWYELRVARVERAHSFP